MTSFLATQFRYFRYFFRLNYYFRLNSGIFGKLRPPPLTVPQFLSIPIKFPYLAVLYGLPRENFATTSSDFFLDLQFPKKKTKHAEPYAFSACLIEDGEKNTISSVENVANNMIFSSHKFPAQHWLTRIYVGLVIVYTPLPYHFKTWFPGKHSRVVNY